jgi:lipoate-protein ligase A
MGVHILGRSGFRPRRNCGALRRYNRRMDVNGWRLILSPALPGADNMALDEALLESVSTRQQPPTLRFYRWDPACLSLGHAQPFEQVDPGRLHAQGWHLVRRTTGGRAILHADELTYSITAPTGHPLLAGGVLGSYRRLSHGLVAGLRLLGVEADTAPELPLMEADRSNPVCFEAPSAHEITSSGRKLIGSAQVRRVAGVLQHGSLPLQGDLGRICEALAYPTADDRSAAAERVRARAITLEQLIGRTIPWESAAESLAEGFRQALEIQLRLGEPAVEERTRADVLRTERFAAAEWTRRGGPR